MVEVSSGLSSSLIARILSIAVAFQSRHLQYLSDSTACPLLCHKTKRVLPAATMIISFMISPCAITLLRYISNSTPVNNTGADFVS